MDGDRFDELARRLGSAKSRRSVCKAAAVALAASVLPGLRRADAAAAKRVTGDICTKDSECVTGLCGKADKTGRRRCSCTDPSQCPGKPPLCLPGVCTAGICGVGGPPSFQSDPANCGACGNACGGSATCSAGACVCGQGQKACGTVCIDASTCCTPSDCPDPDNGSATCVNGVCGIQCDPGFGNCTGSSCDFLDTPTSCGACGNLCPGYQEPNDNVTCSVNQTCTFSCQGEHYDVDRDPSNGCEVTDSRTGNHTQSSAAAQGDLACFDSQTFTITGVLPSDKRVHESPAIVGFDAASGSAPDWYAIHATGGLTCQNDVVATLTVSGSGSPTCYKLTVITDKHTYTAQTLSSGVATINQTGGGQYSNDTDIYFEVQKICSTSVVEAPTYTITGHL
jgi:hypothetical protein